MNRRRFLTLAAAFACAPSLSRADTWSGQALGADVSVTLHGPREMTQAALAEVPKVLEQIEAAFSLYRAKSALVTLNRTGHLPAPDTLMRALVANVATAHALTDGVFDPTVQPLWQALAQGRDTAEAQQLIGWDRVRVSDHGITLGSGQALTFNGIALKVNA
jgi:FAD:protein FMN transferase